MALWPNEQLPITFFSLAQKLRGAVPRFDLWKCSACLEGAREAYVAVKKHWPLMKLEEIAHGSPEGKDRQPQQYYHKVMPAARVTKTKCTKDRILDGLQ